MWFSCCRYFESAGGAKNLAALLRIWDKIMSHPATVYVIYAVGIMCIVVFLIVDTADDRKCVVHNCANKNTNLLE